MPWYDYKCAKCNHIERDVRRPIAENVSVLECPKCKSEMRQIYSIFGFELKGDNWFKDGYSSSHRDSIDDKAK